MRESRIIYSGMPSFSDSIFLFVLALLLFGPKRLPVLARELGKWIAEFRRASNEFKMQMEEELRLSEQADRQKQIAAIEAAAPIAPPIPAPEHPHLPAPVGDEAVTSTAAAGESESGANESAAAIEAGAEANAEAFSGPASSSPAPEMAEPRIYDPLAASRSPAASRSSAAQTEPVAANAEASAVSAETPAVLPIATSGELRLMPPATGLPTPRSNGRPGANPLGSLLDSIPETPNPSETAPASLSEAAAREH